MMGEEDLNKKEFVDMRFKENDFKLFGEDVQIKRASEPTDVIWDSLGVSKCKKRLAEWRSKFFMVLLFLISIGVLSTLFDILSKFQKKIIKGLDYEKVRGDALKLF